MQKLEGSVWGKDISDGLWGWERMEGLVLFFLRAKPIVPIGVLTDCA